MWNEKPSFRFEIDNFSKKESAIVSKTFMSGGCEWYLYVYPEGDRILDEHMSLYLCVANHKSLGSGWIREADFYFVLLNQSNKKPHSSSREVRSLFWDMIPGWGFRTVVPLSSFQEKGFLEKDKLIIEVYVKNVKVVVGEGRYVDINGFQVFASQATLVRKIFAEHPDIAKDFKQNNQVLKSEYMKVLLNIMEVLYKPSQNHSETELADTHRELCELMKVGFKVDWLKLKLEEVSLQRKKVADGYRSRIQQQLEEHVLNLELVESKHEEVSMDRKKAHDADVSRIQQLEECIMNLKLMESKLMEVSMDRKKAQDADVSRIQQLEECIMNLKLMESKLMEVSSDKQRAQEAEVFRIQQFEERILKLGLMESKFEEICLERKNANDAGGSRFQNLEESVKNLEQMESKLEKVSLQRKKTYDVVGSWVQELEERVKNLEWMELDLKLDCLKSKLEEVSLERKKTDAANGSQVQKIKERIKNLELIDLGSLKSKLEEVCLERKKADVDGYRVQQLEVSVKNLEMMVSNLKAELDNEEENSSVDGFFLVDEVD